ncbi:MAG: hypothetical protein ACI88C_001672 [Acidimicrobiales bacterium]|jgi:hypothetical protein
MVLGLALVSTTVAAGQAGQESLVIAVCRVVNGFALLWRRKGGFAVLPANPPETLWCGHIEVSHVGLQVRLVFGCA